MKRILSLYHDIIILTLLAVPIGAAAGSINTLFGRILLWITEVRNEYAAWLLPFLGLAGVVIVWCYQKFGGRSGRGMALIFEAGHGMDGRIPLRLIPFTITGTWLTHLFGGSAGREGGCDTDWRDNCTWIGQVVSGKLQQEAAAGYR